MIVSTGSRNSVAGFLQRFVTNDGRRFKQDCLFQDSDGHKLACANNCKGVDPNSVIIGGGAVLGETSSISYL